MNWKLKDKNGNLLQMVNCQYDACDIAVMMYDAKIIEINFEESEARIIE